MVIVSLCAHTDTYTSPRYTSHLLEVELDETAAFSVELLKDLCGGRPSQVKG